MDSLTYQISDNSRATDTATVIITVIAVNDAPVVSDIPNQSIPKGGSFTTIHLGDYVFDVDNTDEELTWSFSGNNELTVSITNRVATLRPTFT